MQRCNKIKNFISLYCHDRKINQNPFSPAQIYNLLRYFPLLAQFISIKYPSLIPTKLDTFVPSVEKKGPIFAINIKNDCTSLIKLINFQRSQNDYRTILQQMSIN